MQIHTTKPDAPESLEGKYAIYTPSGFKIPITNRDESVLWAKYCALMRKTREVLEGLGYQSRFIRSPRMYLNVYDTYEPKYKCQLRVTA